MKEVSATFQAWFGDSKVVDAQGKPLMVYHGTDPTSDFSMFKPSETGAIWFSDSRDYAEFVSYDKFERGDSKVVESYLSLKNPLDLRGKTGNQWDGIRDDPSVIKKAKADGYDGVILNDTNGGLSGMSYIAFHPEQIKSAIGIDADMHLSLASEVAPVEVLRATNVVCEGAYSGRLLDISDGLVTQKINRAGDTVQHDIAKLSTAVQVGDVVDIQYRGGQGVVSGIGKGVGVGR